MIPYIVGTRLDSSLVSTIFGLCGASLSWNLVVHYSPLHGSRKCMGIRVGTSHAVSHKVDVRYWEHPLIDVLTISYFRQV